VTLQIGAALGTALVASLAAVGTARALDRHESTARALTSGYHLGFLAGIFGPICGVLIAAVFLRRLPRTSGAQSVIAEPALLAE
jgi:hypothetical protein